MAVIASRFVVPEYDELRVITQEWADGQVTGFGNNADHSRQLAFVENLPKSGRDDESILNIAFGGGDDTIVFRDASEVLLRTGDGSDTIVVREGENFINVDVTDDFGPGDRLVIVSDDPAGVMIERARTPTSDRVDIRDPDSGGITIRIDFDNRVPDDSIIVTDTLAGLPRVPENLFGLKGDLAAPPGRVALPGAPIGASGNVVQGTEGADYLLRDGPAEATVSASFGSDVIAITGAGGGFVDLSGRQGIPASRDVVFLADGSTVTITDPGRPTTPDFERDVIVVTPQATGDYSINHFEEDRDLLVLQGFAGIRHLDDLVLSTFRYTITQDFYTAEYRLTPELSLFGRIGPSDIAIVGRDGAIDLPDAGQAALLSPEEARDLAYLYEAGLDRDGNIDLPGLNYWIDAREDGVPLRTIARSFLNSNEFSQAFGDVDTLSDLDFVRQLYRNVLDREGEDRGVSFWTGELALPQINRADVLISFARSAENVANSPFVEDLVEVTPGEWDFV